MPVQYSRLLAKGTSDPDRPGPGRTLLEHTVCAMDAAAATLDACERDVLRSLALDPATWGAPLRRATLLSAFLHDLGKASDHFQAMVRRRRGEAGSPQGHRHELLSFWLASDDGPLRDWLFASANEQEQCAALCAVAGHHLKLESDDAFRYSKKSQDSRLTLLSDHPDFAETLRQGAARLGLGAPTAVTRSAFDEFDNDLFELARPTLRRLRRALDAEGGAVLRRFTGAVKALTLAADVIASAEVRRLTVGGVDAGASMTALAATLARGCTSEDLERVAMARLGSDTPRPFQETTAAATAGVALVRAGCGSGKTVAAYLWAARRIEGRKLFVCYPTTGTATEGFRDYVREAGLEAILYHSRAEVDLELMDNGGAGDDAASSQAGEEWAAYRALQLWPEQVTVCTADTVLGLLQNYRGGLVAFPALARGVYVFDEIHLYDDRMFSALCRFIAEAPGTPILLMTASLQAARLAAVRDAVARRGETLEIIDGPADLEMGERYTLSRGEVDAAVRDAKATLARGEKVLWVCNTVDGAIDVADTHFADAGVTPLVYHGRFRYEDRAKLHRKVVDAFDARLNPGAALAVTTQVCEVSLDLSAGLLVSDVATVPAMIQRLGRLNRRFDPKHPSTRPAIFLEPDSPRPYKAPHVELGSTWLSQLTDRPCSQRDLADAFEQFDPPAPDDDVTSHVWLDGTPLAWPAPLREPEPSILILLPEDVPHCKKAGKPVPKKIARRAIPMTLGPVKDEFRRWEQIGMAYVPPADRVSYSAETGARWVKVGGN
jgi:CRISPR-associated endonuclease/helicase Cas3